ncbi:hypothetical protein K402DRAFT_425701 [Aulographum hederae CBS 113979]|uniref:Uncharacterized protein n=1 Tax=Aulographum hederae CBS 113979 TaxID=1176131 RepID=A0A6G1GJP3_9PEZI|nr:hypothetical protein K402DRAFT_425701 [Aulographum hederae CBS 113979]
MPSHKYMSYRTRDPEDNIALLLASESWDHQKTRRALILLEAARRGEPPPIFSDRPPPSDDDDKSLDSFDSDAASKMDLPKNIPSRIPTPDPYHTPYCQEEGDEAKENEEEEIDDGYVLTRPFDDIAEVTVPFQPTLQRAFGDMHPVILSERDKEIWTQVLAKNHDPTLTSHINRIVAMSQDYENGDYTPSSARYCKSSPATRFQKMNKGDLWDSDSSHEDSDFEEDEGDYAVVKDSNCADISSSKNGAEGLVISLLRDLIF